MKYITTFLLLLYAFSAKGGYREYFQQSSLGLEALKNKDYKSAYTFFESAYNQVYNKNKYMYWYHLLKTACLSGDSNKVISVMNVMVYRRCKSSIIGDLEYDKLEYFTKYIPIVDSSFYYNKNCNYDSDTLREARLDSATHFWIRLDQKVRRPNSGYSTSAIDSIEKEKFTFLYEEMKNSGYPVLRGDPLVRWATLLYHIDNLERLKLVKPYMQEAIAKGELHPGTYAVVVDRCLIANKQRPQFFYLCNSPLGSEYIPSASELLKVNKERDNLGLLPYPQCNSNLF